MNIGGDLLQFSTVDPLNATARESQRLEQDVDQLDLSARAHKNILCVARTIADLADSVHRGSSCLVETNIGTGAYQAGSFRHWDEWEYAIQSVHLPSDWHG